MLQLALWPHPSRKKLRWTCHKLRLEGLEPRNFLAGVTADISAGMATISGTAGNDQIMLIPDALMQEIHVFDNGQCVSAFSPAHLHHISVDSLAGDDVIGMPMGMTLPVAVIGGSGLDTLVTDHWHDHGNDHWLLDVERVMAEGESAITGDQADHSGHGRSVVVPLSVPAIIPEGHVHAGIPTVASWSGSLGRGLADRLDFPTAHTSDSISRAIPSTPPASPINGDVAPNKTGGDNSSLHDHRLVAALSFPAPTAMVDHSAHNSSIASAALGMSTPWSYQAHHGTDTQHGDTPTTRRSADHAGHGTSHDSTGHGEHLGSHDHGTHASAATRSLSPPSPNTNSSAGWERHEHSGHEGFQEVPGRASRYRASSNATGVALRGPGAHGGYACRVSHAAGAIFREAAPAVQPSAVRGMAAVTVREPGASRCPIDPASIPPEMAPGTLPASTADVESTPNAATRLPPSDSAETHWPGLPHRLAKLVLVVESLWLIYESRLWRLPAVSKVRRERTARLAFELLPDRGP